MHRTVHGRLAFGIVSSLVLVSCGSTEGTVPPPPAASIATAAPSAPTATACATAADQPVGSIVTIAGTGDAGSTGDRGPATEAKLNQPMDVVVDAAGVVYVGDASHRVRRIGLDGVITTVAGTGEAGSSGDGGPAIDAQLDMPSGLAFGPDGSLFVADKQARRIRKIDPAGLISTVVGSGVLGSGGDGGPALEAAIQPIHLAIGGDGTLYFDDLYRFRSVANGVIEAFAGTGTSGYGGDGGRAVDAAFGEVQGTAADSHGNVLLVDNGNSRVRKVDGDGVVSTVAGSGDRGSEGDDGPATEATFGRVVDVAVTSDGSWYVSDYDRGAVRRVAPDGIISMVAAGSGGSSSGGCGPASEALVGPTGLFARDGMLYIADQAGNTVRRVALGT